MSCMLALTQTRLATHDDTHIPFFRTFWLVVTPLRARSGAGSPSRAPHPRPNASPISPQPFIRRSKKIGGRKCRILPTNVASTTITNAHTAASSTHAKALSSQPHPCCCSLSARALNQAERKTLT